MKTRHTAENKCFIKLTQLALARPSLRFSTASKLLITQGRFRLSVDTLRWSKSKHQVTMGGEYAYGSNDIINNFRANGQ
ncbi:MAG: hypothetical protein FJW31_04950 [Acidobacteria bacterium]|nr:hypothetical protein [Acidobacteriota bacterium]